MFIVTLLTWSIRNTASVHWKLLFIMLPLFTKICFTLDVISNQNTIYDILLNDVGYFKKKYEIYLMLVLSLSFLCLVVRVHFMLKKQQIDVEKWKLKRLHFLSIKLLAIDKCCFWYQRSTAQIQSSAKICLYWTFVYCQLCIEKTKINPIMGNFLISTVLNTLHRKDKNNEKRGREWPNFVKNCKSLNKKRHWPYLNCCHYHQMMQQLRLSHWPKLK